jgi:kynurenine 3-monooxygenase
MFIAMPNLDGSFTCTLFLPFEGEVSFEKINNKKQANAFFSTYFPNVMQDIENLTEDFFKNPTSAMVTMKCYPWTYWDKVALVGDSAHAIVPFYGQGMNAGFEDIYSLSRIMTKFGDDWEKIFLTFQQERKPNADAIAELSYRNFIEMSSKTANPSFLLQKRIEKWFAKKHPSQWEPTYSRVTFSHRTYAEALAIGDFQESIMQEIMKLPNIEDQWNSKKVEERILQLLQKTPTPKV